MTRWQGIQDANQIEAGTTLHADVVIVGLGAGGSMAFHDLALAGRDVLAIEVGGQYHPQEMTRREEQMLPHLFMDAATRATEDMSISILQGKGIGGSTLHNTNLCKRLPDAVLEHWATAFGLAHMTGRQLQQDFEDVERLLNVHPVPDDRINANNQIMARGVDALGWAGGRLSHNREGCKQSGFCELGCPNNGKQNAAKVLVPVGLEAGGRILTHAAGVRILTKNQRATGLRVAALNPQTDQPQYEFTIEAKRVILAGSATGSASLVLKSDLPDPHRLAGTNLHMHPGAFVAGVFDHPIRSWEGTPQSQDCTEFLSFDDPTRSVWLVSGAAHPGGAAGLMPGFGPAHGDLMKQYPNVAVFIAMLHDHTAGRVLPGHGAHVHVHYKLQKRDYLQLEQGLKGAAQIMLAAGAREVVLPLNPVRRITSTRDLNRWSWKDLGPFTPPMVAVHPMSTLWMGVDPSRSVVNARGEHHHIEHLYVADGSLFPTSIGGPPQIAIYTFGRQVARAINMSFHRG